MLGPLEAADGGESVALGPPRQKALLAVLLIARGTVVSSDGLIDALWERTPPATAAKIVQGYVSNLRRVLGDGAIATEGRGYRLCPEAVTTDVDRFERIAADGRRALERDDPGTAAGRLAAALESWRGPAFVDFSGETFARAEITRLEEARLETLALRVEAELRMGRHAQLIGELQALVRAHPLQEAFAAQLMLALYRCGRQAEALDHYQALRVRLDDELGLEPGRELRELQLAVLAHDPALSPPAGAAVPSRRARRHARRFGLAATGVAALLVALVIVVLETSSRARSTAVTSRPNTVVAIGTGSDRVAATVPVGDRPGAIAAAAGSLWVANRDDDTVSQVDPRALEVRHTVAVPAPPNALASAAGGVWVAGAGFSSSFVSVSRIDPHFGAVDRTMRAPTVSMGPVASLAAAGSAIWLAPYSGELTRIDARRQKVVSRTDPNSGPSAIAVAGGVVWLVDNEGDDVVRIDPTGARTTTAVGYNPSAIAIGDGGVWVTDTGDDRVERLDPMTGAVVATIRVGAAPLGLAVGDGSVWVADGGAGAVSRINPGTDRVTATIHVGGSPQDIAIAGSRAWVTVDAAPLPAGASPLTRATLRIVSENDVDTLDPATTDDPGTEGILYETCAKLLDYPDRGAAAASELIPEVARALPTRSDGGRTYTFTIRRGYRFSPPSDAPVTAQTFRYTIERVLSPRLRSPDTGDFLDIVGARAYHAGRTARLAGVTTRGDRLIVHLTAPAPDFPARVAEPAMCAVPTDTPITPGGVQSVPSAGPYRVASYVPDQSVVLTRNPSYHGPRPRRAARIVMELGVSSARAIADVEHGSADYAPGLDFTPGEIASLRRRYGTAAPPMSRPRPRYHETPSSTQLDYFVLNSHRRPFAHVRLRIAVSEAIDRAALAHLGDAFEALPDHETSIYLPPGFPGYRDSAAYPSHPEVRRARALARPYAGTTIVLATCDFQPCLDQARIVRRNLAAIGLRVRIDAVSEGVLFGGELSGHTPWDMMWGGWVPDYIDPAAMLNTLIATNVAGPALRSRVWRARLAAAARLTGPRRDLVYARLDLALARRAAPLVAFGNVSEQDFFSARIGCERFGVYGFDLGALCFSGQNAR